MFISRAEKQALIHRIELLERTVEKIGINLLLANPLELTAPKRQGRNWTEEQKKLQSEQAKKRWANRKAKDQS